eukprot:g17097.t1
MDVKNMMMKQRTWKRSLKPKDVDQLPVDQLPVDQLPVDQLPVDQLHVDHFPGSLPEKIPGKLIHGRIILGIIPEVSDWRCAGRESLLSPTCRSLQRACLSGENLGVAVGSLVGEVRKVISMGRELRVVHERWCAAGYCLRWRVSPQGRLPLRRELIRVPELTGSSPGEADLIDLHGLPPHLMEDQAWVDRMYGGPEEVDGQRGEGEGEEQRYGGGRSLTRRWKKGAYEDQREKADRAIRDLRIAASVAVRRRMGLEDGQLVPSPSKISTSTSGDEGGPRRMAAEQALVALLQESWSDRELFWCFSILSSLAGATLDGLVSRAHQDIDLLKTKPVSISFVPLLAALARERDSRWSMVRAKAVEVLRLLAGFGDTTAGFALTAQKKCILRRIFQKRPFTFLAFF